MEVVHDLHWVPQFADGSVATVGEFDGVHRGHRVVLLEAIRAAVVEGCASVVVTFDRTSAFESVAPPNFRRQLTSMPQKLELLEALGVDVAVILPSERVFAQPSEGEGDATIDWIVDEVFTDRLKARVVVVGEDFHFGPRRRLAVDTFRERALESSFRIVQIPVDSRRSATGKVMSARSIREALERGEVADAAAMLGRPYEIRATVAVGDRRGRTIGFPTANLPTSDWVQMPADGVYACWYTRPDGTRLRAAVNIGKRPTFHQNVEKSLIEAHLLDFSGDVYAESARLQFVAHLRPERPFDGVESLKLQLVQDVEQVRALLAE